MAVEQRHWQFVGGRAWWRPDARVGPPRFLGAWVRRDAEATKAEPARRRSYTPTNSSWLNRIEAQITALRYFALDGTDHAGHKEQGSIIRRYTIWRNTLAGSPDGGTASGCRPGAARLTTRSGPAG